MTSHRQIAVLAGVFVAGSVSAHLLSEHSPPEIRTVTVHAPPVEHTKIVQLPPQPVQLPPTCLEVVDTLGDFEAFAAVITKRSGQHSLNITQASEAIAAHQQQKLNKIVQEELHIKDKVDSAVVGLASLRDTLKSELADCRADIASGS